jgi:predicted alpha/beta-hydrolase family hydrolase
MRDASAALRVHGHQVLGLQVSQTSDAAQIGFNTAIRSAVRDGSVKIGGASLHGDEAALLVATQIADVVRDGWSSFGTL